MDTDQLAHSIAALEHKKASLLHQLKEIDEQLTANRVEYNRLTNHALPVSSLPCELLSSIFAHIQDLRFTPAFELRASHVCSHWRAVAISTPLLWSKIKLSSARHDANADRTRRANLDKLAAYLSRSGECPLSVSLELAIPRTFEHYVKLLLPHVDRWKRLSIDLVEGHPDELIEPLRTVHAPILEHLSVRICRSWHSSMVGSPRVKFATITPTILTAPSLAFVRLSGKALGFVQPPLESVTTLHLEGGMKQYMSYDQFQGFFTSLPALLNLSLCDLVIRLPQDPTIPYKPTSLPSLRCLRLRGNSTPAHRLFALITLPALESLILHDVDSFDSVIFPLVKSLTLCECTFATGELENIVRAFPIVQDVAFDDSIPELLHLLGSFLSAATQMNDQDSNIFIPWPRLKTLTLLDMRPQDVYPLCGLIQLMKSSTRSLPIVRLTRHSRTILKLKDKLEWLRKLVNVENWEREESWPPGLGYDDEDDI